MILRERLSEPGVNRHVQGIEYMPGAFVGRGQAKLTSKQRRGSARFLG
jgi:hypothetical protein